MRSAGVVIGRPVRDRLTRMIEAEEQGLVQQFVPHPPVEGFHEPVLHGFAGCDVVPVDGMILRPGEDGIRGELGAVIGDDHSRLASLSNQTRQLSRHTPARDRGVGDGRQALAGHVIDDVENPKAAAIGHLIVDESSDQRALALASTRIGARMPTARRLARRLRTVRPSSRYSR